MLKTHLIAPITSLHFAGNLLLSGEGPLICVYNVIDGVKVSLKQVLSKARIHGIRAYDKKDDSGTLFVVFGQKYLRIIKINTADNNISIDCITDTIALPDLVLDAHWLDENDGPSTKVAIATAHNAIWCIDYLSCDKRLVAQCEENSILYSAKFFGNTLNNLLLAAGTVFNQVLLWKVNGQTLENKTLILHRLTGHEGVIFRINFNATGTLMVSVSDDRSIRLWKVLLLEENVPVEVSQLQVMYGHGARVWDAKLLTQCIVSIGEDAVCNVWSYEGELVKKFTGHLGKSIWSLATNEDINMIATGGGDGSIRLFSLDNLSDHEAMATVTAYLPGTDQAMVTKKAVTMDTPRSVCLGNDGKLLVMTSEGCLYEYPWHQVMDKQDAINHEADWKLILKDPNYASYSLMSISTDRTLVAFGNLAGNIKVCLTEDIVSKSIELKPFNSKVLSLLWTPSNNASHNLFSCGPDGIIIWWTVTMGTTKPIEVNKIQTFCIPHSKQRWASAVEIVTSDSYHGGNNHGDHQGNNQHSNRQHGDSHNGDKPRVEHHHDENHHDNYHHGDCHVIFGDRKGSIHLFECQAADKDDVLHPVQTLPILHGPIGVTQLCSKDGRLYSTGRDGTYRQYKMSQGRLELTDTKKVFKGLDWVEKMMFTTNGDIAIAGFHTAFFVVWSISKNEELFKVKCGGGHRAWDFTLGQIHGSRDFKAVFTYLKGNSINTYKKHLKNIITNPILKPSFHGRETTCMANVCDFPLGNKEPGHRHLFVTGSEDTTINLMIYDHNTGTTTKLFTSQGHVSSVRALTVTKSTSTATSYSTTAGNTATQERETLSYVDCDRPCRYLLFSGGGRASLRCWRIEPSLAVLDTAETSSCAPISFVSEYSSRTSHYRRRRKKKQGFLHSEIRFMSLTSFPLSVAMGDGHVLREYCTSLYGVAAACSDGFVRIFIFDEKESKFFLLAQTQYLLRCVLSVQHAVHKDTSSGRLSVLVFAGDTAGKITLWEITDQLLEYVREEASEDAIKQDCEATVSKEREGKTVTSSTIKNLVDPKRLSWEGNSPVAKDRYLIGKSVAKDVVKTSSFEVTTNSSTSRDVNHVTMKTKDSLATMETGVMSTDTENTVGMTTNLDSSVVMVNNDTKLHGSKQETVCSGAANMNENRNFEYSVEDGDLISKDPSSPGAFSGSKESKFSCINLVESSISGPLHVFKAHQSGVNDMAIYQGDSNFVLCSGGDDSALFVAEFKLGQTDNGSCDVHVIREEIVQSAHTSSVTGVRLLDEHTMLSSSTDQRLKRWKIEETCVTLDHVIFVDVPDVQAIESWKTGDGNDAVTVCGVGLQTIQVQS